MVGCWRRSGSWGLWRMRGNHGLPTDPQFREFVNSFEPLKGTLPPNTFYFMPTIPVFSTDAELAHFIVLIGSAEQKALFGYVSLFGMEEIAVVLPYDDASDRIHTYAVDVLTGREASVSNIQSALSTLPWRETHPPGPGCEPALAERAARVLKIADRRIRGERPSAR